MSSRTKAGRPVSPGRWDGDGTAMGQRTTTLKRIFGTNRGSVAAPQVFARRKIDSSRLGETPYSACRTSDTGNASKSAYPPWIRWPIEGP